jgi:exodeoxyribonuclease V alpha subunit
VFARTWAWQFQAAKYRTTRRATVQGMKRYLGSGLVKGIGPVNAGRIVDAFGETTFSVIDETPDRQCGGHHPAHN